MKDALLQSFTALSSRYLIRRGNLAAIPLSSSWSNLDPHVCAGERLRFATLTSHTIESSGSNQNAGVSVVVNFALVNRFGGLF